MQGALDLADAGGGIGRWISVVNAGVEESIFRVALGQGLSGLAAGGTIAILSGVLFGVPHWFGNPSRLPGVLMAGFLGWLMATSMIQTGGIAWAWGIHALQDVVILTALIASAEAPRHGPTRNPAMPSQLGEDITRKR